MNRLLDHSAVKHALDEAARKAAAGERRALAGTRTPEGKMAKDIKLSISQLRLDPANPRIEEKESQIDIRQALLDDQGSKIVELAADIARFQLNPMDRIMVLQSAPDVDEYIALEGNRRVAALQILHNPDLLTDLDVPDAMRHRLIELADQFDPATVEPISGVLMPDRESARRWIDLRHTGQNNGRGIVDWNGLQTARYRGDKTLRLLDFVKTKGNLTPDQQAFVDASFPITTLDRIISNPVVRQKIGIQIMDGEFYLTYPWDEAIKPLKQIVLDLAEKRINVTAVKARDQQIAYVDSLPKSALADGDRLPTPISLASVLAAAPKAPPVPGPPVSPLNRKTLIPRGFAAHIPNQKVSQIFFELKTLNIEKYPIAGATLMRLFVEASVEVFCNKNNIICRHIDGKSAGKAFSLSEKVEAVLQALAADISKSELAAARIALTSSDSVISVGRLNEYVHNPAVFPSKSDLIGSWAGVEPFFRATWK